MIFNHIQHALNGGALNGGEKQIIINKQTYKVDGFCEKIILYMNTIVVFGMVAQLAIDQIL